MNLPPDIAGALWVTFTLMAVVLGVMIVLFYIEKHTPKGG